MEGVNTETACLIDPERRFFSALGWPGVSFSLTGLTRGLQGRVLSLGYRPPDFILFIALVLRPLEAKDSKQD